MDNRINYIRRGLEGLVQHFSNREENLNRAYEELIEGNLMNKILMWIDLHSISDFEINKTFPSVQRDPIYVLLNELLNYTNLDTYDNLMVLLNEIVSNNTRCLYSPLPDNHDTIVTMPFHLNLARLLLQAYDREFPSVKEILIDLLHDQLQGENALLLIRTIKQIGKYYYKNAEFTWAMYCLEIAIDLYRDQKLLSDELEMEYAYVLNLMGLVNLGIGEGPIEYFTEALVIFKQLGNKTFEIYCYQNLGIYYWRLSEFDMSEKYMRMAHELHKEIGNI